LLANFCIIVTIITTYNSTGFPALIAKWLLTLIENKNDVEAIKFANDSEYGLGASIHCSNWNSRTI